ncbi:MAG: 50S ribosomal protein L10 [Parcubacteria group bacterium]|nr:50S ribosomal protein L10 [Parcubacteria group bacterium]
MSNARVKKEAIVNELADIVSNAGSVVFVHFKGLTVAGVSKMRRELRKAGVTFTVVKKTLLRRVLGGSKVLGDVPALEGEIAIAYSEDPVAAAKGIATFQKELADAVVPVGGIFEARYLTQAEIKALAAIPGRMELYGQLVGLLNSPIRGTVVVLNGVTRSFVGVLDQIAKSKS